MLLGPLKEQLQRSFTHDSLHHTGFDLDRIS
jgi:hypothetical protein